MLKLLKTIGSEIKKWNWTVFIVMVCTGELGALSNKTFHSINQALIFGLIIGSIMGLLMAIITKDH